MVAINNPVFQQYSLDAGTPANAGTLTAYDAGTVNLKDMYTTSVGDVETANPLTLDSAGRTTFFLGAGTYDLVLKDSAGNELDAQDAIAGSGNSSGNSTQSVANIAALTALAKDSSDYADVAGYVEKYDGGGGRFFWSASSTSTPNGGTIFAADEGDPGRWLRIYDKEIDVKWFGAKGDGIQDDTAELIACFAWADGASRDVFVSDGTYLISGALTSSANTGIRMGAGSSFNAASSQTVTINGPFSAPLVQCFTTNIVAVFAINSTPELFPQWWGTVGDGSADDGPELVLCAAASTASSIPIRITKGNYKTSVDVTFTKGVIHDQGAIIDGEAGTEKLTYQFIDAGDYQIFGDTIVVWMKYLFTAGDPNIYRVYSGIGDISPIWWPDNNDIGEQINLAFTAGGGRSEVSLPAGTFNLKTMINMQQPLETANAFFPGGPGNQLVLKGKGFIQTSIECEEITVNTDGVAVKAIRSDEAIIKDIRFYEESGFQTLKLLWTGGTSLQVLNTWWGNSAWGVWGTDGSGTTIDNMYIENCIVGLELDSQEPTYSHITSNCRYNNIYSHHNTTGFILGNSASPQVLVHRDIIFSNCKIQGDSGVGDGVEIGTYARGIIFNALQVREADLGFWTKGNSDDDPIMLSDAMFYDCVTGISPRNDMRFIANNISFGNNTNNMSPNNKVRYVLTNTNIGLDVKESHFISKHTSTDSVTPPITDEGTVDIFTYTFPLDGVTQDKATFELDYNLWQSNSSIMISGTVKLGVIYDQSGATKYTSLYHDEIDTTDGSQTMTLTPTIKSTAANIITLQFASDQESSDLSFQFTGSMKCTVFDDDFVSPIHTALTWDI